jgi:nucleoside-diphosphate-sugar epimerase
MRILVTGHSGFIGKHIAEYSYNLGHYVHGVSRSIIDCRYDQSNFDITDQQKLERLLNEKQIDVVVHCAAKSIVSECERDPYGCFKSNVSGTISVLESARNSKVKRVISFETDKVYGEQEELPTTEDAIPNPNSPYEQSKYLASKMNDFYSSFYGMDVISVRPANVLGVDDNQTRLLPRALNSILNGNGIVVYSSAVNMMRSFISIDDVVKMTYLLATENPKHKVYNLAVGIEMTILEFAERVNEILDYSVPPEIVPSANFKEIQKQSIYGDRFLKEFSYSPTSFEEIIKKSYKKVKNNC